MYPVIFDLGPLQIRSYGLLLALAFMAGIAVAVHRGKKEGFDPDLILDLSIYILISSIIGARLYFVFSHWELYQNNLLNIFKVWEGGISVQGGVIMAVIVSYFYVKRSGIEFYKLADVMIPGVALGQAIGRVGCFFNGCCYGGVCDLPWGVTFPTSSAAGQAFPGVAIHPTQLYATFYSLLIFGILIIVDKYKPINGITFFLYFVLIGMARFSIDFIRRFDPHFLIEFAGMELSTSQLTSVVLIVIGVVFIAERLKTASQRSRTKSNA